MMDDHQHMRPSGGYRRLLCFQTTTVIFDATVSFCDRWVDKRSRTHDQMVQGARSGRQNIGEGSRAAATSSQTELRLVNVARASLDELLLDYEDFLRQRRQPQWDKDSPEALAVRAISKQRRNQPSTSYPTIDPTNIFGPYDLWLSQQNPVVVANTIICLINQANYLLDHLITALERQFIQEGGYSEQLAAARIAARQHQQHDPLPSCPLCGKPMRLRTARQGPHAGSHFWGCSAYPSCKGTRPCEQPGKGNGTDRMDRSDNTKTALPTDQTDREPHNDHLKQDPP